MTQTEIITALIRKNQLVRKEFLANPNDKVKERIFDEWCIALEKLSIILNEDEKG